MANAYIVHPTVIDNTRNRRAQEYQMPEREPSLTEKFSSAIGAGLGKGLSTGLENMLNQYQQERQLSLLDQALVNVDKDDPSAVIQATRRAGVTPETQESFLKDYTAMHQYRLPQIQRQQEINRAKEMGTFYNQNPNASPQQALAGGFTPEEINKYQSLTQPKPNASLEQLREKQFQARLGNLIGKEENNPYAPHLQEYAYRKLLENTESGLPIGQAMNKTFQDLQLRKSGLSKLNQIAESPNWLFSNKSKVKDLRKNMQQLLQKGAIEIDEAEHVLKEKGWDGIELDLLTSSVLTPEIIDYFLQKNGNDSAKARADAMNYGFKIEKVKGR